MRRAKASKQELAHVHPTKIPIRQLAGGGEVSNGKHLRRITANAAATTKDLPDLAKNDAPKSRRRKKRDGGGATTSSSESVAEPCRLEGICCRQYVDVTATCNIKGISQRCFAGLELLTLLVRVYRVVQLD